MHEVYSAVAFAFTVPLFPSIETGEDCQWERGKHLTPPLDVNDQNGLCTHFQELAPRCHQQVSEFPGFFFLPLCCSGGL